MRESRPGRGSWNALFDSTLKATGICNAVPEQGDLGVAGATLLKPGTHASSLIWMRMSQRTMSFMPPLATKVPDTVGADRMREDRWRTIWGTRPSGTAGKRR